MRAKNEKNNPPLQVLFVFILQSTPRFYNYGRFVLVGYKTDRDDQLKFVFNPGIQQISIQ